jgi:pilus assembly protein CpaF
MLDRFPVSTVVTPEVFSTAKSYATAFLGEASNPAATESGSEIAARAHPLLREKLLDAKVRLHHRLIEEINLSALEKMPEEQIRQHVFDLVSKYIVADRLVLNSQELDDFITEILDEMTGLGSIEPLLKDPTVGDIMINGHDCVYVERAGIIERTQVRFKNDAHLIRIINKIVAAVGRRVDESQPLCDARLIDGSRVNVVLRPVAIDGPVVSIRKFPTKPHDLAKLVGFGALAPEMAQLLAATVKARITLIVSGGTGTGKTTLLNALSASISARERLITIEDAAEFQLQQPHVFGWKRARQISKEKAKSASESSSGMHSACVLIELSWANAAVRKHSPCCRQ